MPLPANDLTPQPIQTFQHYVPRFLLAHFLGKTNKEKKLCVYSKETCTEELLPPEKIMGENNFYHFPDSSDSFYDDLHTKIESNANLKTAFSKIKNSDTRLSIDEKNIFYTFLNDLITRTPSTTLLYNFFIHQVTSKLPRSFFHKNAIEQAKIENIPYESINFEKIPLRIDEKAPLQPMSLGFFPAEELANMNFCILKNQHRDTPFIISDNPSILVCKKKHY